MSHLHEINSFLANIEHSFVQLLCNSDGKGPFTTDVICLGGLFKRWYQMSMTGEGSAEDDVIFKIKFFKKFTNFSLVLLFMAQFEEK